MTAMTADGAAGRRFIAATADPIAMADLAKSLEDDGYEKVPTRRAPNLLMKLMSLFDSDVKGMVPMLGKKIALDNSATFDVLAWEPTPINDSVTEMAASLSA